MIGVNKESAVRVVTYLNKLPTPAVFTELYASIFKRRVEKIAQFRIFLIIHPHDYLIPAPTLFPPVSSFVIFGFLRVYNHNILAVKTCVSMVRYARAEQ